MKVIRTLKFGLKVESKKAWSQLLEWSKCATAAYNFAANIVQADEKRRRDDIDQQFLEWKKINPIEGAKYDIEMAKYLDFLEKRKMAKREKCVYPVEVERPKMPVKIKSRAEKRANFQMIRGRWQEHRLTASIDINGKNTSVDSLWLNTQGNIIQTVDSSVRGAITRRVDGFSAALPGEKPCYADHPFDLYKASGHYDIVCEQGLDGPQWSIIIAYTGKGDDGKNHRQQLKLRFFPNKDFSMDEIPKTIKIGRNRGSKKWWVALSTRVESNPMPLENKTIGVDLNSGNGNTIVVADQGGEIFRRSMPESLKEIENRIEEMQHRKNLVLNSNGENYKSRKVKKLSLIIRRLHERAANIRKNALHHFSKEVVSSGSMIALEELDIPKMTKSAKGTVGNPGQNVALKASRNRRLLGIAPAMFRDMIIYKSHGLDNSSVVMVNPAYSSQDCCYCDKRGRRNGREFKCSNPACVCFDKVRDADENAAINHAKRAGEGRGTIVEKPSGKTKIEERNEKRAKNSLEKVAKETARLANLVGDGAGKVA